MSSYDRMVDGSRAATLRRAWVERASTVEVVLARRPVGQAVSLN